MLDPTLAGQVAELMGSNSKVRLLTGKMLSIQGQWARVQLASGEQILAHLAADATPGLKCWCLVDGQTAVLIGGERGWVTWTPVWTQSATIAHTVSYARYSRVGHLITVMFGLIATGAGTAGQSILMTQPVAPRTTFVSGTAQFYDASTAQIWNTFVVSQSLTNVAFANATANGTGAWYLGSAGFTGAIASGDALNGLFQYEAAD